MQLEMGSDIRYLKGVGEVRMKLYNKLGVFTVGDLLTHLPRRYIDLRSAATIAASPLGEVAAVRGIVAEIGHEQRIRRGLTVHKVTVVDGASTLYITFFNGKYAVAKLRRGEEFIFYGRVEGTLTLRKMNTPTIYPGDISGLVPVYPLTSGLTSAGISKDVLSALRLMEAFHDPLDDSLRRRFDLCTYDYALRTIHQPPGPEEAELAKDRLIFDELLCLTLGMQRLRAGRTRQTTAPLSPVELQPFLEALPFTLTDAQLRAITEAAADLTTDQPMNRLVQGDVGSGKTVVAAACCYIAAKNGAQSAMMAPTELLANQHYRTLTGMLEPLGMKVALLTGATPAAEKRAVKKALAAGEIDLCVGTHALLTGDTVFDRLTLVVTDEQHRFGVSQRMNLSQKGRGTNVLVMSATPIPRTLALILYGDLELSVIDQMPAGRQPIDTYIIDSEKRERAFGYIRQHLDRGLQAYIVCPLVEETEEGSPLVAATEYATELQQTSFRDYEVGLLHGRMKAKEKDAVMTGFAAGKIQLLISTTVIEVGIDVPSAVIMMVENAERFGLSQLHQLRGRVGRGTEKSCCILLSDAKGDIARQRLSVLRQTNDGFRIAEEDLKLRGPGDFFGMRQHGLPPMQIADLATDGRVLAKTRQAAESLLADDPDLSHHPVLAQRVERMLKTTTGD